MKLKFIVQTEKSLSGILSIFDLHGNIHEMHVFARKCYIVVRYGKMLNGWRITIVLHINSVLSINSTTFLMVVKTLEAVEKCITFFLLLIVSDWLRKPGWKTNRNKVLHKSSFKDCFYRILWLPLLSIFFIIVVSTIILRNHYFC